MTKHLKYFLLMVFCIFFLNCKKKPFDYRNKYWGDWEFSYTQQSWTLNNGNSSEINGTHNGKVYYNKKEDSDLIVIEFTENIAISFNIEKNGNITSCGGSGQFESKTSVKFNYGTFGCSSSALGGGTNYIVIGKKK